MMENKENSTVEAPEAVTIEQVEEEPLSVSAVTVIDEDVVRLLAKIAVRNDTKSQKRRPLYNLLGVGILLLCAWMAYTYFVTKTNTTRGPAMIVLLLIMAGILFWYVNQPLQQFMENRMKPFMGQRWEYTVTDEGVGLTLNGQNGLFQWDEIRGWWLEDGCYVMEVGGQSIIIRQDALDEDGEAELRSLLYIYLGDALEPGEAQ